MNMTKPNLTLCCCANPDATYCQVHCQFLSEGDDKLAAAQSEVANSQLAAEIFAAERPKPTGRIIDGGRVTLRPYNGPQAPKPAPSTQPPPVQPVPLQLLLAAATLIDNQPTPEQWKTLKEAIRALVPSPTGV